MGQKHANLKERHKYILYVGLMYIFMTSEQTVASCIYINGHDSNTRALSQCECKIWKGGQGLMSALDMAEVTHCNF